MNIFDSRNQKKVVKFQQVFTISNNFGNSDYVQARVLQPY